MVRMMTPSTQKAGAPLASAWHEAVAGIDDAYLDRLAGKTRHQWHCVLAVGMVFLALWTAFVAYGFSRGITGDKGEWAFLLVMWVCLVGVPLWAAWRARRETARVGWIRSQSSRMVSIGPAELSRMCAEIGALDLLRCPEYTIYDEGSDYRVTESATCLAWVPVEGPRRFFAYAHVGGPMLFGGYRSVVRVTIEIRGGWARAFPDFGVDYGGRRGFMWARGRKDPTLSLGSGVLAPRTDMDFGNEPLGGSLAVR